MSTIEDEMRGKHIILRRCFMSGVMGLLGMVGFLIFGGVTLRNLIRTLTGV